MKRARRLLVGLMAVVMLFGMSMTTFAAPDASQTSGTVTAIKKIADPDQNNKSVSSVIIYTNGTHNGEKTLDVTYTWDDKNGTNPPLPVKVSTSNRAVVTVEPTLSVEDKTGSTNRTVHTCVGQMKMKAVGNGQATVTVKSADGKKSKTLKVTVKTYADDIIFDGNVVKDNTVEIANTKNSTLNLGAVAVKKDKGAASDSKVTYSVGKNDPVTVDKKGNVKIKNGISVGAMATIKVTTADKNYSEDIIVNVVEPQVASNGEIEFGATVPTNKKIELKANKNVTNKNRTCSLTIQNCTDADLSKNFLFKSDKPNVATVDANGKITAVGNGKAKITVTPKLGNKVSGNIINVTVTTDVETVSVAKEKFTIIANGKDTAQIGGATNANASRSAVKYELTGLKGWNKETGNYDVSVDLGSKRDVAKYITIDKKGNVKAKKECQAVVRAYADSDNTKDKTVTITAVTPVKTFDVTSDSMQAAIRKNKVTIYRLGKENGEVVQNPLTLKTKLTAPDGSLLHEGMTETEKVTWTSNKPAVATVVPDKDGNYQVKANGNGTAVLTATAKDGSKATKKITVTVKTNAYDITIAKAQPSAGIIPGADAAVGPTQEDEIQSQNVVYVVGKADKDTSYKLASVIKAVTNSDASTKTVKYYTREKNNDAGYAIYGEEVKTMKMRAGDTKVIYVVAGANNAAKDVDKYGNLVTAGEEKEVKVTLACIDESNVPNQASDYLVEFTGKYAADADGAAPDVLLKVGATDTLEAKGVLDKTKNPTGKVALDATAITWKSSNTKVVTVGKDGKLTGKKPGIATITATYKFEYYENGRKKTGTVPGTRTVYVGRSDKDVLAQVNKTIDATLKAENRDWTGVTSKFNSKNNTFALDITQPNNQLTNMKNSGFATALKEIANGSNLKYSYAAIFDNLNGGGWELQEKAGTIGQFEIRQQGSAAWEGTYSFTDAVQTIFNSLSDTDEQDELKYWNGKDYTVTLGIGETPIDAKNNELAAGRWFDYEVNYKVTTSMAANVYDGFIDGEIASAVDKMNHDDAAAQAGLEKISFIPAANEFEITVDPDKTLDELDPSNEIAVNAKNSVAEALATVLEDAKAVTLNIDATDSEGGYKYNGTVTKAKAADESIDDLIDGLMTEYFNTVKSWGVTTLGDLAGSIVKADVTFEDGTMAYTQSYRLYLFAGTGRFTNDVADSEADEVITRFVSENAEQDFATAAYEEATNTLTVSLKDGIAEMTPQEFKDVYDTQANRDKAKQVLNDMYKAFTYDVRQIKVTFNGKTETVTQSEITDAINNENSEVRERIVNLIKENVNTIRDLTEKGITVEVLYAQSVASDAETVSVPYTVKVTAPAASADGGIEEETTEEESTEETTEEETTEETTEEEMTEEETTEEESTEEESTEEESTEEATEEDSTEEETTTEEDSAEEEETTQEDVTEEITTEESTEAETTVETTIAE